MKLACPFCLCCRKYEASQPVGFAEDEPFVVEGTSKCCNKPIRVTFSMDHAYRQRATIDGVIG